jgi:hypothetical protein
MITTQNCTKFVNRIEGVNSSAFFSITSDVRVWQQYATRVAEDVAFKLRSMKKVTHRLQLVAWNAFGTDSSFYFEMNVGANDTVLLAQYMKEMLCELASNPIACNGFSFYATELVEEKPTYSGDKWSLLATEMDSLHHRYNRNVARFASGI